MDLLDEFGDGQVEFNSPSGFITEYFQMFRLRACALMDPTNWRDVSRTPRQNLEECHTQRYSSVASLLSSGGNEQVIALHTESSLSTSQMKIAATLATL